MHHLVDEATPELENLYAGAYAVTANSQPQIIGVVPTSEQRRLIRRRDCSDLSLDRPAW
jgi:hypothetical protein